MHVNIQKSMFERYEVEGDITEVRAVLAQLGFDPSRYVQAKVDEDITDVEEEPKEQEPIWEEVERGDLRVGDIVRVKLDFARGYEAERRVTARANEHGKVAAVVVETGRSSPISGGDIYSSIQLDARRTGSEWETVEFKDIVQGDYVRTTYYDGQTEEGSADRMNTYDTLPADWMDRERGVICDANRSIRKIERKVK